jgi:hypothetical protein
VVVGEDRRPDPGCRAGAGTVRAQHRGCRVDRVVGAEPARNRSASGKAIKVTAEAVASHLSTGLLPASGSGQTHRPLSAPGAQPMQPTPATSRKTPKVAKDDLPSAERDRGSGRQEGLARLTTATRHVALAAVRGEACRLPPGMRIPTADSGGCRPGHVRRWSRADWAVRALPLRAIATRVQPRGLDIGIRHAHSRADIYTAKD